MNPFVLLILLFVVCEIVLTAVQFLLRKRKCKLWVRILLIVLKFLLSFSFAALVMAGPVQLRVVQPLMMAAYLVLLGDAVADLFYSVYQYGFKKERKFVVFKVVSLLFGIAILVYGMLNMQYVSARSHTYTSEKLFSEHKVVFVADMHVGSAQPFSVTEKTVDAMRKELPDALILGGDITDDYTTKEEMQATFALFKDFGCPVYYIFGNHDLQPHAEYANGTQYTEQELESVLTENGILILRDTYAQIGTDLLLLGREDISAGKLRKKASKIVNPLPEAYLIVADHQPVQAKENLKIGMDLQLSGHTHAGQLFPLKWLYALIGGYVYGDYEIGDAVMNVSAGACGWRLPLRTDAHCNYEVITLKPAPRQAQTAEE